MIVVTGASGHVGGNLIRTLLKQGNKVRVLIHNDRRAIEGLNVDKVQGNILDLDSLKCAFDKADIVFHTAAYISLFMNDWPRLESINIHGTKNVVEACRSSGIRLVHFSSIHALAQEPLITPIDESRPFVESRCYPPYDRSKAAAEKEVLKESKNGLDVIIINPTAIIGPHDFRPSHTGAALLQMARGTLPALVKGGFDWVDVRDVVHGAITAANQAPTGAKYLLSGHWVSLKDMAAEVTRHTNSRPPRLCLPHWIARMGAPFVTTLAHWRGRHPLYTRVSLMALKSNRNISHARATRELGYHPRPFEDTIKDTLDWFSENAYLNETTRK